MEPRTINAKPAAGLLGGALSTLTVGLLARYTSYSPSPDEVGAIVMISSFGLAWLIPEGWWSKATGGVR